MPNWLQGMVTWAKGNKGVALGLGGLLLVLLFFLLTPGGRQGPVEPPEVEDDLFGGEALPGDVTTAKALSEMQVTQELLRASLEDLRVEAARNRRAAQLQKERLDAQDRALRQRLDDAIESGLAEAVEVLAQRQPEVVVPVAAPPPRLRVLRPGGASGSAVEAPGGQTDGRPAAPGRWVRLPAGSVVAGSIMTGAFATKVRGDGLPVLAQLRTAYVAPNDYEVPLEGCLMIGKATADMLTIRARVEAVTLSCVLPDGTSFEREVRGYFTGEDGTLGIPGKWQHRSGAWLANLVAAMGIVSSGVYGSVQINEALGAAYVVGDRSLETATRLEAFFLERAEEILPVVWVETLTPVYVVMLEGVTIEGLPEMEHAPWASAGLD